MIDTALLGQALLKYDDETRDALLAAITNAAQTTHEVNRAYCEALGDTSQPAWDDAPEWQRESAINGALFHYTNPDATPAASHGSWLAEKATAGWKYGPVKDPEKKEHPCFVPYAEIGRAHV